jgi:stigma-specific protein Stig1
MRAAIPLAALLAACDGSAIVGLECRAGRVDCGGTCVDLQNDRDACGACDVACPEGLWCVRGECVIDGGCGAGRTACDGQCVDTRSDPANCGACGVACAPAEVCLDGACEAGCGASRVDCDGACVDVASDPANCGGCGVACDPAEVCVDGACTGAGPCTETLCGDTCTDVATDEANCGACGQACEKGEACFSGACVPGCAPGRTDCGGDACVDLDADPTNCGDCGRTCAADEVCSEGLCGLDCGEGLVLCDRSCVDLDFDPDHCGACGAYCDTGLCELGECLGGEVGHFVLVGHDYGRGRRDQNRIVGNSVFIARGATVDVLVYREASDAAEVENVYAALDQVSADVGRSYGATVLDPDDSLADALAAADVLLVMDQEGVGTDALETLGASWAEDLDRFLRSGGVLVVSDGGDTWALLDGAGLVDIASSTDVTGSQLDVVAAADGVAAGMPARYRAEDTTVSYDTAEPGAVVECAGAPVVIHEAVLP